MHISRLLLSLSLAAVLVAGCLSSDDPHGSGSAADRKDFPYYHPASAGGDGNYHFEFDHADTRVHFDWAPGNLGKMKNLGDTDIEVTLPFGFLGVRDTRESGSFFQIPTSSFTFAAGTDPLVFLAPPSAHTVDLVLDGTHYTLDPTTVNDYASSTSQVISGEHMWDLEAIQETRFPHREPGQPNYRLAIDYFQQYFEDLGYAVEVDPYGTQDAQDLAGCLPAGLEGTLCPEAFANIVATKPGADPLAPTIFVAGGHYDMVPNTVHAAFDDTSGTVGTMELARAMAPYNFTHTLKFALWGGEESGILGSQFWIQTHPEAKATITSYWNLDVIGMSYPAPLPDADPVIIAAGPDLPSDTNGGATGPIADVLVAHAQELQTDWFGYPTTHQDHDVFLYEGIVSGQATGYAAVNAQSDHTPFMAAGIPAYFIFNGDALAPDNPVGIHNNGDTLDNMTKYSYFGGELASALMEQEKDSGMPYQWDPADLAAAKQALAQSWETTLWFPFYDTILQDTGYWRAPGVAGTAETAQDALPL